MPSWIIVAIIFVLLAAAALAWIVIGRSSADPTPDGPTIDEDALVEQLRSFDVDLEREQTPPPDLLAPMIRKDEQLIDATRAQIEQRKALLALLDDRLVSVEATLGRMGGQARVIPFDTIESTSHRTNMGGELTIEADGTSYQFTHIPLRKFERFVGELDKLT
jgi:hypothetical protein